jgi:hypothetical protein
VIAPTFTLVAFRDGRADALISSARVEVVITTARKLADLAPELRLTLYESDWSTGVLAAPLLEIVDGRWRVAVTPCPGAAA